MALTPQDNEAFFREVDERVREQQLIDLWQRHGRAIIAAVVLVLVAAAGVLFWQAKQRDQSEARAEQLTGMLADLDEGKAVKPAQLVPLGKARQDGYRVAAKFLAADLALRRNDSKSAIAGYGALATDASLPQPYRDLALIRQTAAEFDQLPPATIIARMKPLAVADGPWLGSAGEMLAAAYMRAGKPALAAPVFTMIARDEDAPVTLRSRASKMASMLGTDAGQVPAAKD